MGRSVGLGSVGVVTSVGVGGEWERKGGREGKEGWSERERGGEK